MTLHPAVAVIGDIVGSRQLADRGAAQGALLEALKLVNETIPAVAPLAPTVGDEFQGLYDTRGSALRATLVVRLALAGEPDTRFGIGEGEYERFPSGDSELLNGSAWWRARDAIETAKKREIGRTPTLRTWFLGNDLQHSDDIVNAYLLSRDHLVSEMDSRSRQLTLGAMRGTTQVDLAADLGITQSAVSRNLQRNGAFAIIDGAALLEKGAAVSARELS